MKSIKLLGLSLLAVFALGASVAASASAEAGFLPKQATANALGGASTLATAAGQPIVCTTLDESIVTFVTDKHATAKFHWLGCKAAGLFAANSLGAKSEEILAEILLLVCLDAKNGATLVDNFGIAGEVVGKLHLEVPAAGVLTIVTGTALGAVLTAGPAKLYSIEFKGSKGVQTITECLEGANKKVHNLTAEENENKKPEAASENVEGGLLQFKEDTKLEDS
jgi:hypothetical protein